MLIRPFKTGGELALLTLFQSSVRELAARDYTPEQIDAWAPKDFSDAMREQWTARIRSNKPWVVEIEGELACFADLQTTGYIDQFFVAPGHSGKGIGSALMKHLHQVAARQGINRLFAHVSLTAQAFFTYHGFVIEEERFPVMRDVVLPNALMGKNLNPSS